MSSGFLLHTRTSSSFIITSPSPNCKSIRLSIDLILNFIDKTNLLLISEFYHECCLPLHLSVYFQKNVFILYIDKTIRNYDYHLHSKIQIKVSFVITIIISEFENIFNIFWFFRPGNCRVWHYFDFAFTVLFCTSFNFTLTYFNRVKRNGTLYIKVSSKPWDCSHRIDQSAYFRELTESIKRIVENVSLVASTRFWVITRIYSLTTFSLKISKLILSFLVIVF